MKSLLKLPLTNRMREVRTLGEDACVTMFDKQLGKVTRRTRICLHDDLGVKSLAVEDALPMSDDGEGPLQQGVHKCGGGLSHRGCSLWRRQLKIVSLILKPIPVVPAQVRLGTVHKVKSESVCAAFMRDDEAIAIVVVIRHEVTRRQCFPLAGFRRGRWRRAVSVLRRMLLNPKQASHQSSHQQGK